MQRNSTDSGLDTSIQENRIYATESASDWNLIYEHKDEFDGEPIFFKNPGNIISDPQNAGPADTHTTFDKADVCHGRRIDFRKGASNVSQMEMYDTYCLVVNKAYATYITIETLILHGQEEDSLSTNFATLPIKTVGDRRILTAMNYAPTYHLDFTDPTNGSNIGDSGYTWSLIGSPTQDSNGVRLNPGSSMSQYIQLDYFPLGPKFTVAVQFKLYRTHNWTTPLNLGWSSVGSLLPHMIGNAFRLNWWEGSTGKNNSQNFTDVTHYWNLNGKTYNFVLVRNNANIKVYMNFSSNELELIGSTVMSPTGMDTEVDPLIAPNGYQIGYGAPSGDEYMDALVKNFTYWDKALTLNDAISSFNTITSPPTTNLYSFINPMKYEILSGTIHLGLGTWILENVPESHPIGIEQSGTNIEYYGDDAYYAGTGSETGPSAIAGVNYYFGRVTIYVKGDFGSASFHCANHGYMGGQYILQFTNNEHVTEDNPVNPFTSDVSLGETLQWPPRSTYCSNDPDLSGHSYGKIFQDTRNAQYDYRMCLERQVYGSDYADGTYWMCSSPWRYNYRNVMHAFDDRYSVMGSTSTETKFYGIGFNSDGTLADDKKTGGTNKSAGYTCVTGIDGAYVRIRFPTMIYPNYLYLGSMNTHSNLAHTVRKFHLFASNDGWKTQTELLYVDDYWNGTDESWSNNGATEYYGQTTIMPNGGAFKFGKYNIFDKKNNASRKEMFNEYAIIVPESTNTYLMINAVIIMGQKEGTPVGNPSVNLEANQTWPSESLWSASADYERLYYHNHVWHTLPGFADGVIDVITERCHSSSQIAYAFHHSPTTSSLFYHGGTNCYIDDGSGEYVWEGGQSRQTAYHGYGFDEYPGGFISIKLQRRIYPTKIIITEDSVTNTQNPLEFTHRMITL